MFKVVCAYCKGLIKTDSKYQCKEDIVSHGICEKCLPGIIKGLAIPLDKFLDSLDVPVLLIGSDVRVMVANASAQKLVGKQNSQIAGQLGGDVFDCEHSRKPGGCGKTVHCQSCVIRHTVTETMETGKPFERVPAIADIDTFTGKQKISFFISTEKKNNIVILKIENAQAVA